MARHSWTVIFAMHGIAGGLAWWLLPHGFPPSHLRFWSNTVVPLALVAMMLLAVVAQFKHWDRYVRAAILGLPIFWLALGIAFSAALPRTGWKLGGIALGVAFVLGLRARRVLQRSVWREWPAFCDAAVMLALGVVCGIAQRGRDPATHPLNVEALDPSTAVGRPEVELKTPFFFAPGVGRLRFSLGSMRLDVDPLLTFISRSPDRGWTLLASRQDRENVGRKYRGFHGGSREQTHFYSTDGATSLAIAARDPSGAVQLEAITQLGAPVYSHLNSYTDIDISGYVALAIEFSPCPGKPIAVVPAGYPFGRPARCAYLDEQDMFHVVEASSGEKGPFRELAGGPLKRSDPLVLTLLDDGKATVRITFDDWAAQASTQLSPTAGWGLPENAIEFFAWDDGDGTPVSSSIFVTLAATSMGRGFDSVGHAAGTYRNRMRIEPIKVEAK